MKYLKILQPCPYFFFFYYASGFTSIIFLPFPSISLRSYRFTPPSAALSEPSVAIASSALSASAMGYKSINITLRINELISYCPV
jgi:hypothetical protein